LDNKILVLVMLRYKFLSVMIVLGCLFFSLNMVITGYEKLQEIESVKTQINSYESSDVLDPESRSSGAHVMSSVLELEIPKIDLECQIRSDTVNAYNSVYHYPESVEPGKNGECGLLGHRTTYSGPFRKIGKLDPGDLVIIKDIVKSKKYTYKVTSNGDDVRWDYKKKPVKFAQTGEARLLLITCYPPGRKQAAWITHCKMTSVSSLK